MSEPSLSEIAKVPAGSASGAHLAVADPVRCAVGQRPIRPKGRPASPDRFHDGIGSHQVQKRVRLPIARQALRRAASTSGGTGAAVNHLTAAIRESVLDFAPPAVTAVGVSMMPRTSAPSRLFTP